MHNVLKFILPILLIMSLAQAQQQPEKAHEKPLKPGDKISFEVKLTGPDADKITGVSLNFGLQGQPSPDQAGFVNGFGGNSSTPTSPGNFTVVVTVGPVASGMYRLNQASAGTPDAGHTYNASELENFTVEVQNPKTFIPPKITIKKLP